MVKLTSIGIDALVQDDKLIDESGKKALVEVHAHRNSNKSSVLREILTYSHDFDFASASKVGAVIDIP